ncbi:MAG: D-alanyl-D-alanine carboxypeptidase family protein [Minisyncoccales bacterium]
MERKTELHLTFLKLFIAFFGIFTFGWWATTDLENQLTSYFSAKIIQPSKVDYKINTSTPFEDFGLKIEAKSALSVRKKGDNKKILYKKFPSKKLPIASLTKLMTALIVLENYDLDQKIEISKEAINQNGTSGKLELGEEKSVKNLLEIMLIRSSNDAAWALTELMGTEKFISEMNSKAKELKLNDTHFINPTGLEENSSSNYSTAKDLSKLVNYLLENKKIILLIGSSPSSLNTNKLLLRFSNIIGSKTGYTTRAGGCLLVVLKDERGYYYINLILGSKNRNSRFEEMEKIINISNNLKFK